MKFLAVTACPSGVAHTYMAAEAIQQACEKAGVPVQFFANRSDEAGATADAVILTTDMPIKNVERFDNLKKVKIGVGPAIKQADAIVEKMISMLK